MIGKQRTKDPAAGEATIGEMMFAKAVLEEKNEIIDQKDSTIRELASRLRGAEHHADELHAALSEMRYSEDQVRVDERQSVLSAVISDIVGVTASWQDLHGHGSTGLAARIFELLEERYGLQVIDEEIEVIDPELHRVIEVEHSDNERGGVETLARGYRLGETVIRPAFVKVSLHATRGAASKPVETGSSRGDRE